MTIYTYSHCIICYRKDSPPPPALLQPPVLPVDEEDDTDPDPSHIPSSSSSALPPVTQAFREVNKRREASRRFFTLASRYLNIDPYHYHQEKTLFTKNQANTDCVCEECFPMVKSFCETYERWTRSKLLLDLRIGEIASAMRNAETENAREREKMLEIFKVFGEEPDQLDDFRSDFQDSAEKKLKEGFPIVVLPKTQPQLIGIDEDSMFVRVTETRSPQEEEEKETPPRPEETEKEVPVAKKKKKVEPESKDVSKRRRRKRKNSTPSKPVEVEAPNKKKGKSIPPKVITVPDSASSVGSSIISIAPSHGTNPRTETYSKNRNHEGKENEASQGRSLETAGVVVIDLENDSLDKPPHNGRKSTVSVLRIRTTAKRKNGKDRVVDNAA